MIFIVYSLLICDHLKKELQKNINFLLYTLFVYAIKYLNSVSVSRNIYTITQYK